MIDFTITRDILFEYKVVSAETLGPAKIVDAGSGDLQDDKTFETTVIVLAFTDRRADNFDVLPKGVVFKHGFFGDLLVGRKQGSKLWLLGRAKNTEETARLGETYFKEAWQPLIDDGFATEINVTATRLPQQNTIFFKASILKTDGRSAELSFAVDWVNKEIRGAL